MLMSAGELRVCGDAGMNAGTLLSGGTVVIEGNAGEFAAADMRAGVLIIKGKSKGFVGGKMCGGTVFLKGGGAVIPPVRKVPLNGADYRLLMRTMRTNQIEAMMYTKYSVGTP
jgi:formylmethanofuran dehydrogenase subunit C